MKTFIRCGACRFRPNELHLLDRLVVWDCPDMTTWAATNYSPRLLEVAGLADILVYVASDERYNDEVPTQFLRLLLQANKTVIVVIVKMRPEDAQAFLDHFQKSVLSGMPNKPMACLAVPHLSYEQLADPVKLAGQYRIPLINQISVLAGAAKITRHRTVTTAMNYIKSNQAELLGVTRSDLVMLEDWKSLVMQGESEFLKRYRREFLAGERFPRFDEALVKLLDLLELPGIGKVIGSVLRAPFQLVKGIFNKALQRPDSPPMPERPVLEGALSGWTDALRKEAARRATTHPVWAYIDKGFSHGLTDQVRRQFEQSLEFVSAGDERGSRAHRPRHLRGAAAPTHRPEHPARRQAGHGGRCHHVVVRLARHDAHSLELFAGSDRRDGNAPAGRAPRQTVRRGPARAGPHPPGIDGRPAAGHAPG